MERTCIKDSNTFQLTSQLTMLSLIIAISFSLVGCQITRVDPELAYTIIAKTDILRSEVSEDLSILENSFQELSAICFAYENNHQKFSLKTEYHGIIFRAFDTLTISDLDLADIPSQIDSISFLDALKVDSGSLECLFANSMKIKDCANFVSSMCGRYICRFKVNDLETGYHYFSFSRPNHMDLEKGTSRRTPFVLKRQDVYQFEMGVFCRSVGQTLEVLNSRNRPRYVRGLISHLLGLEDSNHASNVDQTLQDMVLTDQSLANVISNNSAVLHILQRKLNLEIDATAAFASVLNSSIHSLEQHALEDHTRTYIQSWIELLAIDRDILQNHYGKIHMITTMLICPLPLVCPDISIQFLNSTHVLTHGIGNVLVIESSTDCSRTIWSIIKREMVKPPLKVLEHLCGNNYSQATQHYPPQLAIPSQNGILFYSVMDQRLTLRCSSGAPTGSSLQGKAYYELHISEERNCVVYLNNVSIIWNSRPTALQIPTPIPEIDWSLSPIHIHLPEISRDAVYNVTVDSDSWATHVQSNLHFYMIAGLLLVIILVILFVCRSHFIFNCQPCPRKDATRSSDHPAQESIELACIPSSSAEQETPPPYEQIALPDGRIVLKSGENIIFANGMAQILDNGVKKTVPIGSVRHPPPANLLFALMSKVSSQNELIEEDTNGEKRWAPFPEYRLISNKWFDAKNNCIHGLPLIQKVEK